jgi:hypothetical protein
MLLVARTQTGEFRLSDERKYGEEEVSEIFERATSDDGTSLPMRKAEDGLTLGELQEVGEEIGLHPERVAAAAAEVGARLPAHPRKVWLGNPVGVGRAVDLPRAATDREWQIILADLRQTFRAHGQVEPHGETHTWHNGNLHAFLEPTGSGTRLRMSTQKGGSKETTIMGAGALAVGLLLLVTSGLDAATFGATFETMLPALLATGGGGVLAANYVRLRSWAAKRESQMEAIAGRARELLSSPSERP